MKQIVDRLKGHIEAGFEPMPRGDAPADDTLQLALAEIERVRGALADEWARIAELRCRIAELGERS